MEIMIQDPTYSASMRLGEALVDACTKGVDGAGAFAFAEENGIDLFLGDPDFATFIKSHTYKLIVGTDSITDSYAVASLRAYKKKYKNLTVYAYVHDSRKYLFHPKLTWFQTPTGGISLIGSGNLTERGLYHNVEIYGKSELNTTDFNNLKLRWDNWVSYSISNNLLFDIDDPIVDYAANLSALKKSKTFSSTSKASGKSGHSVPLISPILSALYGKQPKSISAKIPKVKTSVTSKKASKPTSATSIIAKPIPATIPVVVPPVVNPVWNISSTDRVLVAEVPKSGNRWKQINFDKDTFENYFGATAGSAGGTYRILLKNTDSSGTLAKTETRPSVSVLSHNWRFEIEAAGRMAYPVSDRPIVVFVEVSTRSFIYELLMPGDTRYSEVDTFVKNWKIANGKNPGDITRIGTDVTTLKASAPSLGLWKV